MSTLGKVLTRGGATLKPFQPQLQAAFLKALSDPVHAVRAGGARSLALLAPLMLRLDPLLTELTNAIDPARTGYEGGEGLAGGEESTCLAIEGVLRAVPSAVTFSPPIRARLLCVLRGYLSSEDSTVRRYAAGAYGCALRAGGDAVCAAGALAACALLPPTPPATRALAAAALAAYNAGPAGGSGAGCKLSVKLLCEGGGSRAWRAQSAPPMPLPSSWGALLQCAPS